MHVPDGFLSIPVSIVTGAVAMSAIAMAVPSSRKELIDDRQAPMVGIVATVVFAAQMLNFPVGAGTSGHLLGGALAAVLVGPWTAVLVMSVVLIVQAFVFADGGITALGTNITLIGLSTIIVGWLVFTGLMKVLPRRRWRLPGAAAVAAFLSVPASAAVFTLLFWIGGQAPVDIGAVAIAMLGWHVLIGIGEALITAAILTSIVAVRPDLVFGTSVSPIAARSSELQPGVTS